MGDIESEQSQRDFEVEISDLDKLDSSARSPRPGQPVSRERFSPHQRRRLLLILNGVLVLALISILVSTAPVRGLVSSVFIRPTPIPVPTLVPGVDLFYVRADPPWGQLTIDGRSTALPTIGVGPPLRLAIGQHLLTWQADPFPTQRCTVSVPLVGADTCHDHESAQIGGGLSAWVISFTVSLESLSNEQQTALLQAAQAALDARQSTDTVRPGEHYVLAPDNAACASHSQGYQCYATANQSLKATLSFHLDMNKASIQDCINPQPGCTFSNQDCRLFCGISFPTPSSAREWDVFVPALSLWTFTTMDGKVLVRDVPDNSAEDYATGHKVDESLVRLDITWDSLGWHVALPANMEGQDSSDPGSGYFNPICAAMIGQVTTLAPPPDVNGVPMYLQWQFMSGKLPAAGCLGVGTPIPQPADSSITSTPTHSSQPVFYFLHRFGVLLPANKQSQSIGVLHLEGQLPPADAHEQQLAQELIGR